MNNPQKFETVAPERLVETAGKLKADGWRLVQIGATRLAEQVELTYSFDRQLELCNFRATLPAPGARVPSISGVFWCAFLYENEIHDLFDVQVDGMAVDFHGNFYKTKVKYAFGTPPAVKPAAPKPAAPKSATAPAAAPSPAQPAAPR